MHHVNLQVLLTIFTYRLVWTIRSTEAMRYGTTNEPIVSEDYIYHLQSISPSSVVKNIHILPQHPSSPDGLVKDPETTQFSLKRTHTYYYQVQGQMLVTKQSWCDYYVWTPRNDDGVVEWIYVDQSFITDIFTKLKKYYFCNMLPELASPRTYVDKKSVKKSTWTTLVSSIVK